MATHSPEVVGLADRMFRLQDGRLVETAEGGRRMILLRASARHLARHPWQVALSVLGIALGVAVVVSIDLASESARRAFALSAEAVTAGRRTRSSADPAASTSALSRACTRELGVHPVAPVVEGWVGVRGRAGPDAPAAGRRSVQRGAVPPIPRGAGGQGRARPRDPRHRAGRGAAEPARRRGTSASAPGDPLVLRVSGRGAACARRGADRAGERAKRAGARGTSSSPTSRPPRRSWASRVGCRASTSSCRVGRRGTRGPGPRAGGPASGRRDRGGARRGASSSGS